MGIAHANTVPAATAPAAVTRSVQKQAPDREIKSMMDKDNLKVQQGSQVQDKQGIDTEKSTGFKEKEAKDIEVNEKLLGGGHADPVGANVNHDFQGVE
ncbi:hypothetical protein A6M21_17080 [Desulfotomaculum copahuensis]|uniref:Uncharacterized protein n=2 Tax=Desulfotomaculum copahuensis TaxID=1838280 RepID=A0A1B7LHJ9_9FIRM|nr:hypothetical protein A6M21_17080 [Desulfotomaculum copahuensis]